MALNTVQFAQFTKAEQEIVNAIVRRAGVLFLRFGHRLDGISLDMDIAATHVTCPLRLADLLAADDFNFTHDVGGIMNHLDRTTGELRDFFSPRFSLPRNRGASADGAAVEPARKVANNYGTQDRNAVIVQRVRSGESYAVIGRDVGISRQRVQQIVAAHAKKAQRQAVECHN